MDSKARHHHGHISAYPGDALFVVEGANHGDLFATSRDLCLGDAYQLAGAALPMPMRPTYARKENAKPGGVVHDCDLTLMSDSGQRISAQLFASLDTQGCVKKTHLRTDKLLFPKTSYVLIDISRENH